MSFGRDLRSALFRHVMGLSGREAARFGAPSLITRNTNDVQQVQMLVAVSGTMMIGAPVTGIGAIIMAVRSTGAGKTSLAGHLHAAEHLGEMGMPCRAPVAAQGTRSSAAGA